MNVIETLTQRNEAFAISGFSPGLKILPSMATLIIGCVDPRVDPVDLFKLQAGEAAIIRDVAALKAPILSCLAVHCHRPCLRRHDRSHRSRRTAGAAAR